MATAGNSLPLPSLPPHCFLGSPPQQTTRPPVLVQGLLLGVTLSTNERGGAVPGLCGPPDLEMKPPSLLGWCPCTRTLPGLSADGRPHGTQGLPGWLGGQRALGPQANAGEVAAGCHRDTRDPGARTARMGTPDSVRPHLWCTGPEAS